MSTTSTTATTTPRPLTFHSRTNSTRSRKHSAPVRIHALLRTSTENGSALKHNSHDHRRGASLSASGTVSPTPIDSFMNVSSPLSNGKIDDQSTMTLSRLNLNSGLNGSNTHFHSNSHFTSASSSPSRGRQRSHSYASAPLSTLLTRLDSSSLASFTPADVYPCASGSLKKCQSLLKANGYGECYGICVDDDDDEEATNYIQFPAQSLKGPRHTLPNMASPLSTKSKLRRVLPSRLLQKKAPPPSAKEDVTSIRRSGSDSESNSDRESDLVGASDTPSLSPHSSRPSSRSRSSASISPSSSNLLCVPFITRRHSGLGELDHDKPSSSAESTSEAVPALSPVAVRTESHTKVELSTGSGSLLDCRNRTEARQDPGTASEKYKTGRSLTIQTQDLQTMQTECAPSSPLTSSLSPPPRTLRSSRNRQPVFPPAPSALPDESAVRVPFPMPSSKPSSAHPTALSPTSPSPDTKRLLTLSDLERTSKLMRSTTTCAVCGRSGSDFPRCPRTGATWCSRACRITAKNKLKGRTADGGDAS